jgi:single-stranded-DNA-specific exonuclease
LKYQLRTKNYNNETVELALHDLLIDRGIKHPLEWLQPNYSYEHSPMLFKEMRKGIEMLKSAISNSEASIMVVVDSDLDGYTSGAIILNLLKLIQRGQDINFVLHPNKEHGIVLEDIPDDVDLLIVPDAGSSQKAEHLKLLENGTKVIILDHHEMVNDMDYGQYQDNIVIINSQEEDYPNHALSGAGVALKFAQAYCERYGVPFPNKLYALAACGIVADVMDIGELENKQIVMTGLKYLREHLFLYQLIKDTHYNNEDPEPTIKDIGWVIGPNINAIIRLGTQEQKNMIFKSLVSPMLLVPSSKRGEEDQDVPVYQEAVRLCKNAKKRQTTAVDRSIRIIESELQIKDTDRAIVYVDENQELTFELSGLIANKLLSQYNRPVILLRHFRQGNVDELRGSARGKSVEGLDNLKDTLSGITGVQKAEGHAFAFGVGVDKDMLSEFRQHLNLALSSVDFNVNLYMVDLIAKYNELNIPMAEVTAREDIWGHGVDKPVALLTDIPTDQYDFMGNEQQHLKINCGKYDVLLFNVPELTEQLSQGEKFDLDAVGEFSVDKSFNVGRLQFVVNDFELKEYTSKTVWDLVF